MGSYPVDAGLYNLVQFLVREKNINMFAGWNEPAWSPGFLNFPRKGLEMFLQLLRASDVEFDIRQDRGEFDHIPRDKGERDEARAYKYPGVMWYRNLRTYDRDLGIFWRISFDGGMLNNMYAALKLKPSPTHKPVPGIQSFEFYKYRLERDHTLNEKERDQKLRLAEAVNMIVCQLQKSLREAQREKKPREAAR